MPQQEFYRSDFGDNPMAPSQDYGPVRAKFFKQPMIDEVRSKELGKAFYREVDCVELQIPGDLKSSPVLKVTQRHKDRFPKEYAAFLKGEEYAAEGLSLDKWGLISKAQVMTLKVQGFDTVEQFADANETIITNLGMGFRQMQAKARAYKNSLAGEAQGQKFDDMQAQIDRLTQLLQGASGELVLPPAEPPQDREGLKLVPADVTEPIELKRGPGRPRKIEEPPHEAS